MAIIIVSILPLSIQFLKFEVLLELSSFMIASAMFFQLVFYVYARHGRFGFQKQNQLKEDQFRVKGGVVVSLLLVTFPFLCSLILWAAQGWVPLVVFVGLQLVMFIFMLIERLARGSRGRGRSGYENLEETTESSVALVVD